MDSLRILSELPTPLLVIRQGCLVFANTAAHSFWTLLGFDAVEPWPGDGPFEDWLQAPDRPVFLLESERVLQSGLALKNSLFKMLDARGNPVTVLCSLSQTHFDDELALLVTWTPLLPYVPEREPGTQPPQSTDQRAPIFAMLSARQREIVSLLCEGLDTRQMAQRMDISVATVRVHLRTIFRKTRTHSRVELVRLVLGDSLSFD